MRMESGADIIAQRRSNSLSLVNIVHSMGGKRILQGLSMELEAARVGIVGRNGSGKSTLAKVLAGLVVPESGQVRINGHDLAKDRRQALREIGILFQNPDHQLIFPTVDEEITFGLRQHGASKREAEDICKATLARFGKLHWWGAHVTALSQGQKHLLCLIAVAAMAPSLILLDEPFSGLDIPTRLQLTRYLDQYEGGLLHISHAPEDLAGYDVVIWLEDGQIVASGRAREVLRDYRDAMEELGGSDDISDLSS